MALPSPLYSYCLCRIKVDFHCPLIFTFLTFTRVNEIEAIYEKSRVNVKLKRDSTFTFKGVCERDLSYMASILFTRVKFTAVRT